MSVLVERLQKIQMAESFIPQFSERKREDRVRAVALAKVKFDLQKELRAKHPELTDQEFRKHWVAFCAINNVAV